MIIVVSECCVYCFAGVGGHSIGRSRNNCARTYAEKNTDGSIIIILRRSPYQNNIVVVVVVVVVIMVTI